jgi:type I restriction enzyme S subunit
LVLFSDNTRRYYRSRAKKAVQQASINQQDVSELPFPLPPFTEQQAIAALVDRVDGTLGRAREERDRLRLLKESSADALLTGRVRV